MIMWFIVVSSIFPNSKVFFFIVSFLAVVSIIIMWFIVGSLICLISRVLSSLLAASWLQYLSLFIVISSVFLNSIVAFFFR